ncbi:MAG: lysylphosphatidylglycerol synthase transmembrane domain-containing protein [Alphaproteobacteria bacterium]|nr:lysylphosphatidylglycerol synthase transmembrane domain-containing protein [Alphaproteobacteria bacterium]MDP6516681.1 lysylphosphatidylglycerol synthase transmembrane domain-containing protein [Alphaproteobacteria bacterium]
MIPIAGSAVLLVALAMLLPLAEIWRGLGAVPVEVWLLAVGGFLACHGLGALKWSRMLEVAAVRLRFRNVLRYYLAGLAGNLMLPSVIGGDVISVGLAARRADNSAGAILGSVLNRLLDAGALALFVAIGLAALPGGLVALNIDLPWNWLAVAVLAVVLLGGFGIPAALRRLPRRQRVHLRQATRAIVGQPLPILAAFGLGVAMQAGLIALTILLGTAVGLELPLSVWLMAWALAKLAAFLPISQAGIGTREVAFAIAIAPFGAPPSLAVAAALAWNAVLVCGCALAGLLAGLIPPAGVSSES